MRFVILLATFVTGLISASVFSLSAKAAGYTCLSVDRDMQAIVYMDKADSKEAKRVVFIDPELSKRTQVVAIFTQADGVLASGAIADGLRFTTKVDLDIPTISHAGKHLGGTTVGLLDRVVLDVQTVTKAMQIQSFTEGSTYAGQATYVKKDGQTLTQDFDCALFLGDDAPVVNPEN